MDRFEFQSVKMEHSDGCEIAKIELKQVFEDYIGNTKTCSYTPEKRQHLAAVYFNNDGQVISYRLIKLEKINKSVSTEVLAPIETTIKEFNDRKKVHKVILGDIIELIDISLEQY